MKLQWAFYLAIVAAPPMSAATIVISAQTNATVRTGEAVVFHLLTSSFAVNARNLGIPVDPTGMNFELAWAPPVGTAQFAATLESDDGIVSIAFGDLLFHTGVFTGSGYSGAVSTLEGRVQLSPELSAVLFSAPSVMLSLRNEGPDVMLGLEPYLLRQDLFASLSGGQLKVGLVTAAVELETLQSQSKSGNFKSSDSLAQDASVPEPRSGLLLLGGAALFCGLAAVLARFSESRV